MMEKIHIVTLYSIAVAIAPVIFFVNSYYAHAEDVEKTYAEIMLEIQSISLETQMTSNKVNLSKYKEKKELTEQEKQEYQLLQEQKLMILESQNELIKMRRGLK